MNLETSKKVLKIAGILTIIGGVFALVFGIIAVIGGGVGATAPEIETDNELQEGVALAIAAGILFVVTGIISLIEGIISYKAGKTGKKGLATASMIFAVLSVISQVSSLFKTTDQATSIVGNVLGIAINCLVVYAAYIVRKNADEQPTTAA